MSKEQTYDERIEYIHAMLKPRINLVELTNLCMNIKTSEFKEFERSAFILDETGNEDGKWSLVESITE